MSITIDLASLPVTELIRISKLTQQLVSRAIPKPYVTILKEVVDRYRKRIIVDYFFERRVGGGWRCYGELKCDGWGYYRSKIGYTKAESKERIARELYDLVGWAISINHVSKISHGVKRDSSWENISDAQKIQKLDSELLRQLDSELDEYAAERDRLATQKLDAEIDAYFAEH